MCFLNVLRLRAPRHATLFAVLWMSLWLSACGGGGGASSTTTISTPNANAIVGDAIAGANVLPVTVDSGPAGSSAYLVNRLFTDVTLCIPGTTTCQTLDHVLVDTGSTGLRVIAPELNASLQGLPKVTGGTGRPLLNCARFLDGSFAWGPVANVDLKLAGKTAANVPIQLIADSLVATPGLYNSTAATCSSGTGITQVNGTNASALGAKGILGIGHLKEDCGPDCVSSAYPALQGYYYECSSTSAGACNNAIPATAPLAKQVKNPVPLFSADNNGLVVVLPSISPAGAERAGTMQGSIVFGVDTQGNNSSAGATLLQLDGSGYFTATINGVSKAESFLDTGSNALFFDTLLSCSGLDFYCPPNRTTFTATFNGTNNVSKTTTFDVKTAQFNIGYSVYPLLAGPLRKSTAFDGGLPFFYGRRVFVGIEGASSALGAGAYYGF